MPLLLVIIIVLLFAFIIPAPLPCMVIHTKSLITVLQSSQEHKYLSKTFIIYIRFDNELEKVPSYGRHFPSSCRGLQPLAATIGALRAKQ